MSSQDHPQIYLATPSMFELSEFSARLAAALDSIPVACLRITAGVASEEVLLRHADHLRALAHERDIPVVIDDHFRLAAQSGLDGYMVQKPRTFEPPMPEEFGVVRADHNWRAAHPFRGFSNLSCPRLHEVSGVFCSFCLGCFGLIDPVIAVFAANGVILDSRESPHIWAGKVGANVLEIRIESDIAVEVPVVFVSWVACVATPDLQCRFVIAPEDNDSGR